MVDRARAQQQVAEQAVMVEGAAAAAPGAAATRLSDSKIGSRDSSPHQNARSLQHWSVVIIKGPLKLYILKRLATPRSIGSSSDIEVP